MLLLIIINEKSVSSNEQNHGETNAYIRLGRSSEASLFGASFFIVLYHFKVTYQMLENKNNGY